MLDHIEITNTFDPDTPAERRVLKLAEMIVSLKEYHAGMYAVEWFQDDAEQAVSFAGELLTARGLLSADNLDYCMNIVSAGISKARAS